MGWNDDGAFESFDRTLISVKHRNANNCIFFSSLDGKT